MVSAALLSSGPAAGQEAEPARPGEGGNVAVTLVEAKPPFFLTGPGAVLASNPEAYVRRVSTDADGDQQLLVATVSDGDVMSAQSASVRGIERIAEVGSTVTFWGEVLKQTQSLTVQASPTVGFILGAYGGKDPLLRDELITGASGALQRMEEVFLVARVRGGADLLAMYAIDDAMGASDIEIEIEGFATQTSDTGP